jgi:hypothetical protein
VAVNVAEELVVGCGADEVSLQSLSQLRAPSWNPDDLPHRFNLNKEYSSHGSVCRPESIDSALCAAELVLWHDSLQDLECGIPELVVLSIEQNNETGGLGVEGGQRL